MKAEIEQNKTKPKEISKISARFLSTSPKKSRLNKLASSSRKQNFPSEREFDKIKRNIINRKGSQNIAIAKNWKVNLVDTSSNDSKMSLRHVNNTIKVSNTFDQRGESK